MRELTLEELQLVAGGADTIVVTGDRPDDGGWDWGDWYDTGGDGGGGGGGGGGDQGDPPDEYPACIEAAPAGVSPTAITDAAKAASAAIAAGNDENIEYGAFIYELNGQVSYTPPFTNNSPDSVNFSTGSIPDGARVLGMVHNHPDQSGIDDRYPSENDWDAYNQLQAWNENRGITIDPNMLMFIYSNEDKNVRGYDNTDKNQQSASCAL